jgi:hypothetical protein
MECKCTHQNKRFYYKDIVVAERIRYTDGTHWHYTTKFFLKKGKVKYCTECDGTIK